MENEYTANEIASITGVHRTTLSRRVKTESWPAHKRKARGGGKAFYLSDLPEDIRTAIAIHEAQATPADQLVPATATSSPAPICLSASRRTKALARADLVRLYSMAMSKAPHGQKGQARKQFLMAYKAGAWPELLSRLGERVSIQTIERWKIQLRRTKDPFTLADRRGLQTKRGSLVITDEMGDLLLRQALHPNQIRVSRCIEMTRACLAHQGVDHVPSAASFRRWLNRWTELNYHVWVFLREGAKAWNDKVAYYIERDMSLISVGDILVADGHVLNFQTINPWTGTPCRMKLILWYDMASNFPLGWEVMPQENTQTIAAALRRALMRLGKPARIAYLDNGKAFRGKYFNGTKDLQQEGVAGLFERIGMETIFAWPYHGQAKTVERFFGYFGELEQYMPSATGHCIEMKPAYQKRGEFVHREIAEENGHGPLTLEQTHHAIAVWFDMYVQRPQPRSHLEGKTPLEVFEAGRGDGLGEDHLSILRECMLQTTPRMIGQNGVTLPGNLIGSTRAISYYASKLYGRRHKAFVRWDPQDLSVVDVYDQDWNFICSASRNCKGHPAARIMGTDEDRALLKSAIELRKHQEAMAGATARQMLSAEIMPEYKAQLAKDGLLPPERPELPAPAPHIPGHKPESAPEPGMSDEEMDAALAELDALNQPEPKEANGEDAIEEYEPEAVNQAELFWDQVRDTYPEADRYESLLEAEAKGMVIPSEFRAFMTYYEKTRDYARQEDYWQEYRMKMALLWATETGSTAAN